MITKNQLPPMNDEACMQFYISGLVGIASLMSIPVSVTICICLFIALSVYTIFTLWRDILQYRQQVQNAIIYPYLSFDGPLRIAVVFLYLIIGITLFIIVFMLAEATFGLALSVLFVCIMSSIILLLLRYKKRKGIYGIAIHTQELLVSTSTFRYQLPLATLEHVQVGKKHLDIHTSEQEISSPIRIQRSMLAENHKYEFLQKLQQYGIQVQSD